MIGLSIFLVVCISVSLVSCRLASNYFLACLISASFSSIIFQILNYLFLGYLDPFFIIAFTIGTFYALIVSVLVGFFVWRRRKDVND